MSTPTVILRELADQDMDILFVQQQDPVAIHMAAFTAEDPTDREAFDAHWAKVRADASILIRTILYGGQVAGSILSHGWFGEPELSYWLGREFWGKGIATAALNLFLEVEKTRPLYARVAHDNIGSMRVLEKCGFVESGRDEGYAHGRKAITPEIILKLD